MQVASIEGQVSRTGISRGRGRRQYDGRKRAAAKDTGRDCDPRDEQRGDDVQVLASRGTVETPHGLAAQGIRLVVTDRRRCRRILIFVVLINPTPPHEQAYVGCQAAAEARSTRRTTADRVGPGAPWTARSAPRPRPCRNRRPTRGFTATTVIVALLAVVLPDQESRAPLVARASSVGGWGFARNRTRRPPLSGDHARRAHAVAAGGPSLVVIDFVVAIILAGRPAERHQKARGTRQDGAGGASSAAGEWRARRAWRSTASPCTTTPRVAPAVVATTAFSRR